MSTSTTIAIGTEGSVRVASLILVAVDDHSDPAYQRSLSAAIELARGTTAGLLLYDRSTESLMVDPYPFPELINDSSPLDTVGARFLGRDYLAQQIEACMQEGVPASAWLPRARGPKEMARCARSFGVDAAILPVKLQSPSLKERVRGNCLGRFREELQIPIVVVTAEGKLQVLSDAAVTESRAPLAMDIRPAANPQRRSA
ncbi:MAG: hypothetical protein QOG21_1868 [Actinomycetota bacterium]|nr:hypothetical protein [Actinomycetota bacterium]